MSRGQGLLRRCRQRGGHAAHAIQPPPEQEHVNAHAVSEVADAEPLAQQQAPVVVPPQVVALLDGTRFKPINYHSSTDAGTSLQAVERPLDCVNGEFTTVESVVADHVLRRNSRNGPIPRAR